VKRISDGGIVLICTPDELLNFQEYLQEKLTLGTLATKFLNSSASTIIATTP
jgi:hypothetical protein